MLMDSDTVLNMRSVSDFLALAKTTFIRITKLQIPISWPAANENSRDSRPYWHAPWAR